MKPAIFKTGLPIFLIPILLIGIAYSVSKFFRPAMGQDGQSRENLRNNACMAIYIWMFVFGAGRLNIKRHNAEIEKQV
jgi:hypothetical protein